MGMSFICKAGDGPNLDVIPITANINPLPQLPAVPTNKNIDLCFQLLETYHQENEKILEEVRKLFEERVDSSLLSISKILEDGPRHLNIEKLGNLEVLVKQFDQKTTDLEANFTKQLNQISQHLTRVSSTFDDQQQQITNQKTTTENLKTGLENLKLELARMQGRTEVLSQQQGSSGSVNVTVSPTTTQTNVTETKTSVDTTNIGTPFYKSRKVQAQAAFCALLLVAALCTGGPEALVGVVALMCTSSYLFNKYKEFLRQTLVIITGGATTIAFLILAAMAPRNNKELSSMLICAALISAGSTASLL